MTHDARKPGPFARLWRALLEASEVAVAARYHAPWAVAPLTAERSARNRGDDAPRAGRPATCPNVICSEIA